MFFFLTQEKGKYKKKIVVFRGYSVFTFVLYIFLKKRRKVVLVLLISIFAVLLNVVLFATKKRRFHS